MKFKTLSTKIVITVFICFFAINTALITTLTRSISSSFEEIYESEANTAMQGFTHSISNLNNVAKSTAEIYSNKDYVIEDMKTGNVAELQVIANDIVAQSDVDSVFFTDINNKVISSYTVDEMPQDIAFDGITAVQSAMTEKKSASDKTIVSSKNSKEVAILYSSPIIDNGTVQGSLTSVCYITKSSFLDNLHELTGAELTIFIDNVRINTTISIDGKRQVGTTLNPGIADTVITNKQEYIGPADILGVAFVTKYTPVLNEKGELLYTLFAGKDISHISQVSSNATTVASITAIVASLIAIGILILLMLKLVRDPFKRILNIAHNIETGDIGIANPDATDITVKSSDEMGQMSKALGDTAASLRGYIGEISEVLKAVSDGDLTVKTSENFPGDFIGIKIALDKIVTSLNDIITRIIYASELVSSRSEQISTTAMSLSNGSTNQASTLEELSATINDVYAQVKENATSAKLATELSKQSSMHVNSGNSKMEEMLQSMSDINTASAQISKIIKTIDDIAFQTNILALNAAVEAARAGAAGKGFAVVADEVRNLATKSAEAAKQTTGLIENTISLVENGTRIANSTAETFKTIIDGVDQSSKIITQISVASHDQAVAIAEINDAVEQISMVVQTTSATAEESAATSEELSNQAHILKTLVEKFKTTKEL